MCISQRANPRADLRLHGGTPQHSAWPSQLRSRVLPTLTPPSSSLACIQRACELVCSAVGPGPGGPGGDQLVGPRDKCSVPCRQTCGRSSVRCSAAHLVGPPWHGTCGRDCTPACTSSDCSASILPRAPLFHRARVDDSRYKDRQWLKESRRWPPRLVADAEALLDLKSK